MKLIEPFNNFLRDTVNLNQTRIDTLEEKVETIKTVLNESDYKARIRSFSPQGSWAHKTIIKPQPNKGFDVDLLMFLDPLEGWSPADYIENLYSVFQNHGTYKDKVSRNTRCVMIDYAGDFSIDIVPILVEQNFSELTYKICNRKTNRFEPTAPQAYSEWLCQKNSLTGSNQLRKVIRLMKYLRDIKGTFSAKSILLTTLLGSRVLDQDNSSTFTDLPTTLKVLLKRLDDWLQKYPEMPIISNPVLPNENFNRHWDQDKYENFRRKVNQYRTWIDEAYSETDRSESIVKWQRVFGEDFAKGEMASSGSRMAKRSDEKDVVEEVKLKGTSVLAKISSDLPHVKAPIWRFHSSKFNVMVNATEYASLHGKQSIRRFGSGEILQTNRSICFQAVTESGVRFSDHEYKVFWQVVNTGQEALEESALRGGFYKSEEYGIRWESTKYHGAHWVRAFVILKRTNLVVGVSDRFFVVVD